MRDFNPLVMKRLACCRRRTKDFSIDFEEHDRVVLYNGLETRILDSFRDDNESGGSSMTGTEGCVTIDSPDEEVSSCSSSKDNFGSSFSSQCLLSSKQEEDDLDSLSSLHHLYLKGKSSIGYSMDVADIDTMKERFSRLLLGEDISGGTKAISTALALSNAIHNLSVSVFGELWKLEPLSQERKSKWRREMDWLLSPTHYMVELVPTKQNGANGGMLEIMTPKARGDIHMTLPALQKLDSMLIEVLDSMIDTEFWYSEDGSRAEGRSYGNGVRQSKKWWLPSPRVPESGLSSRQRKKLVFQAKYVHQILKAAKSINEQVLLQIPIPAAVKDVLPKSARASLGESIYQAIVAEPISLEEILFSLNLKSEHSVHESVNQLEGAIYAWKQRITDESCKNSPRRYSWTVRGESRNEIEKMVMHLERAEALLRLLKIRFPNLPQTFINVTKVQYNKDIGHAIVEAYSRILVGLAVSILSRIGDIMQEDDLKKPSTPISNVKFDLFSDVYLAGITETPPGHIKRSLIEQMNMVDGRSSYKCAKKKAK